MVRKVLSLESDMEEIKKKRTSSVRNNDWDQSKDVKEK